MLLLYLPMPVGGEGKLWATVVFFSKLHLASPSVLVFSCDLLSPPTGIKSALSHNTRRKRCCSTTPAMGDNKWGENSSCWFPQHRPPYPLRYFVDCTRITTHYSNKVSLCLRYSCNCCCLTQYCLNRRSSDTQKRDVHFSRWHRCLSVLRTKFVNMCKTRQQEICIFYFSNTHRFKTTTPPPFPFARSTSKGRSVPSPMCCRVAARSRQMYNIRHVSLHLMHARTYCYKQ